VVVAVLDDGDLFGTGESQKREATRSLQVTVVGY
jgi:hypothetical protein